MITPEDLDQAVAGVHECAICGLEIWGCVCSPVKPRTKPTAAEIERSRAERLARAERK